MILDCGPMGVMGNQGSLESGHVPNLVCLLSPWSGRELGQGQGGHQSTLAFFDADILL